VADIDTQIPFPLGLEAIVHAPYCMRFSSAWRSSSSGSSSSMSAPPPVRPITRLSDRNGNSRAPGPADACARTEHVSSVMILPAGSLSVLGTLRKSSRHNQPPYADQPNYKECECFNSSNKSAASSEFQAPLPAPHE